MNSVPAAAGLVCSMAVRPPGSAKPSRMIARRVVIMPELIPAVPGTLAEALATLQGQFPRVAKTAAVYPCCLHCCHGPSYVHQEPCQAEIIEGEVCPDA